MDINLIQVSSYFLLAFLALFFSFGVAVRLVRRFYHFPIPSFLIPLLDNPVRRRIQSPRKIADRIDLRPGMSVVEVGPGTGPAELNILSHTMSHEEQRRQEQETIQRMEKEMEKMRKDWLEVRELLSKLPAEKGSDSIR